MTTIICPHCRGFEIVPHLSFTERECSICDKSVPLLEWFVGMNLVDKHVKYEEGLLRTIQELRQQIEKFESGLSTKEKEG